MKVLFALLALIAVVLAAEVGLATLKGTGTGADSAITGTVYFVQLNTTHVWVWPEITGIATNADGEHGLHVHQFGDVGSNDGLSSGGHYVGAGTTTHGCPVVNVTRHEGDMGNWNVASGVLTGQQKELDLLALTGGFSIIGKAVVLHSTFDDCSTPNTGAAGSRIAYGVVGIANPTYYPSQVTDLLTQIGAAAGNTAVSGDTSATKAIAIIRPTTASTVFTNVTGVITFEQTTDGLVITGAFSGLNPELRGFGLHVHFFADLLAAGSSGAGAGGHFNTTPSSHGAPPDVNRHNGDLGNICTFDSNGIGYYQYTLTDGYISINGNNNILGRIAIVHALFDTANATTDYGARIAQGVIGIYNTTAGSTFPFSIPSGVQIPSDPRCPEATTTTTGASSTTASATGATTTSSASIISCGFAILFMIIALLF